MLSHVLLLLLFRDEPLLAGRTLDFCCLNGIAALMLIPCCECRTPNTLLLRVRTELDPVALLLAAVADIVVWRREFLPLYHLGSIIVHYGTGCIGG